MSHPIFFVDVASPTWLLYVSLLIIALFFRFSRLFSVRNFDLALTLILSSTLVVSAASGNLTDAGPTADPAAQADSTSGTPAFFGISPSTLFLQGRICLLAVSVALIGRLIFDERLTRRPRLEQNINEAGMRFLMVPAFIILIVSVFALEPPGSNLKAVESGRALLAAKESAPQHGMQPAADEDTTEIATATETLLAAGATGVAQLSGRQTSDTEVMTARVLVALAHAAVVFGLLYVGRRHFDSTQLGLTMSCLYLLLPCTAYNVHALNHVLPAACLVWAFAMYRKPAVAGILLGLACGTLFFAVFLIPLWAVFYGRRGALRFGLSLAAVAAVVLSTFALTSADTDSFIYKLVRTANWTVYRIFDNSVPDPSTSLGHLYLRVTLAAAFFVMLTAMTFIPRRRNVENLLSNSTALIVAAQLWYPQDVGNYVLWYLPLMLMVVFRPRLDQLVPPDLNEHKVGRPSEHRDRTGNPVGRASRATLHY